MLTEPDTDIAAAISLHNRGDGHAAEQLYRRILARQPVHFDATYMLGTLLLQRGDAQGAVLLLTRCRSLGPPNHKLLNNLGLALTRLGQMADAVAILDQAIFLKPDYISARLNRANALRKSGKLPEALAGYEAALACGWNADAQFNRGSVLEALGRAEDAAAAYQAVLAAQPDFVEAHTNLGNIFKRTGDYGAALAHYDRALQTQPGYAAGHVNRAAALFHLRRFVDAKDALATAIAIDPSLPEAWTNRGNVAREEGRFVAAMEDYAQALSLRPNDVQTRWNRGLTRLLLGQWAQGWADYELRQSRRADDLWPDGRAIPEWAGEDLTGRRILVYSEQGLGDCIQFSRFCAQLAGAEVTLLVPRRLLGLLSQLPGVEVVAEAPQDRHFDFCAPLMSLPRFLGFTPSTIPGTPPLAAQSQRRQDWQSRLPAGFKVAICWQGSPAGAIDRGRSIPLHHFAPLAQIPGVSLISLQQGKGVEQLEDVPAVQAFADLDAGEDAFLDSAAIIANCDLVLSSDTAIAHLAGAMGARSATILKYVPDWRWLTGRQDTPWYPAMRLYRQARLDDWAEVFGRIAADLVTMVAARPVDMP